MRAMKAWTTIIAILSIATLAGIALMNDINGSVFFTAVAAISGLGGYAFKGHRQARKDRSSKK